MADTAFDPFARPDLICCTDRYKEIRRLRAYYDSTQYDKRPDWFTGAGANGGTVPLRERKPCVIYALPKAATLQVVRFMLGDGRFPTVKVPCRDEQNEDQDDEDDTEPEPTFEPDALEALELDEESAEQVQRWLGETIERSRLKQRLRALARCGVALRTSVAVMSLRDGRYMVDMPSPEDCWARFKNDDPGADVTALVWCYEFDKTVLGPDKKPQKKRFWFRRAWDDTNHYVWPDVEKKLGVAPEWGAPQAIPHGLGFCPVIWTRNSADSAGSDLDGQSIYEGLEDQFDALNFAYSQRHRGIFYLGVPQPYETGVDDDDGPEATGRKAGPVGFSQGGGDKGPPPGAQAASARRMAPDELWSYRGEKVTLGLLETTGKAFEVATKHIDDIRSRCCETMGVVLSSMADTTGRVTTGAEMSAKFLALAHAPLIALVSELRHCWWADAIEPMLSMMLRMCAVLDGKGILVPGSERVAKILKPFLTVEVQSSDDDTGVATTVQTWMAPRIEPLWGRFFEPSALEIGQGVDAANKALDGGLVSHERATQYIADDFGIEDVAKELAAIEGEKADALQSAHDAMSALGPDAESQGQPAPGSPPGAGPKQAGNAGAGSSGSARAPGRGAPGSPGFPAKQAGPVGVGGADGGVSPGNTR